MISDTRSTSALKIGATSGLIAGIVIWMYEALVWVGAQHLLQLGDIPRNATGLVFGKEIQNDLGAAAYFIGTLIHFSFSALWGALFAPDLAVLSAARLGSEFASNFLRHVCLGCYARSYFYCFD